MLQWAQQIRAENPHEKLASSVTQFVVGAVGDTDLELLAMTDKLYEQARLARVYYSRLSARYPEHSIRKSCQATEAIREFRLYQSSFLLRDYQWDVEELPFLNAMAICAWILTPKLAWAEEHLIHQPIEIMRAEREQLMRVPGIGQSRCSRRSSAHAAAASLQS